MSRDILDDLKKAILEYDNELAMNSAKKVVEQGLDPLKALDVMTNAIKQVGDGFRQGQLWLPDLVAAGETMSSAMPIIEEEIKKRGGKRKSLGIIVIGTVYGDIHSIGKDIVTSLLRAEGFDVHDLGVDVEPRKFVEAIKEYNADILAMSALMSMTALEQKTTIEILKKDGLRDKVKVMVGGIAVTPELTKSMGADGYDPTAPGAVRLARRWITK